MLDIATSLAAAKQLDEAIGLIGKLVGALSAKPDLAALKLAQALDEVGKTLQAVDGAAATYLSLGIDEGALEHGSKHLLDITGGTLSIEIARGRGHCHLIGDIYHRHLKTWFGRVLNPQDQQTYERLFTRLGDADSDLFARLESLAGELETEAHQVLALVVGKQIPDARQRILATLVTLQPLRTSIAKTMQELYRLKGHFVLIAQGV
jgi:hypothetical protein